METIQSLHSFFDSCSCKTLNLNNTSLGGEQERHQYNCKDFSGKDVPYRSSTGTLLED